MEITVRSVADDIVADAGGACVVSPSRYTGAHSPAGNDAFTPRTYSAGVERSPAGGGTATLAASSLNLINNVVGAGLFSMPWAMKRASVFPGLCICLATCLVNGLCYMLLARCCDMSQSFTYLQIGTQAFGPTFGTLAQFCVLFYSLGSSLSFVVLVGDFLSGETGVLPYSRQAVTIAVAAVVFLPLSFLRNTEALKWSSFASFIACFGAAWLVISTSVQRPDEAFIHPIVEPHVEYLTLGNAMFSAVPVMNVAFTAHYNAPRFYQELSDRSPGRWRYVILMSMGFALAVYASVGVCGYITFGAGTKGSILLNYSPTWRAAVFARVFLALVVMFTFPLSNHAVRESIFSLMSRGKTTTNNASPTLFTATTVALVTVSVVVGLFFKDIEKVLAVKGAVFGTAVVYLFPPLMYTRLADLNDCKRLDTVGPLAAPPRLRPQRLLARMGPLVLVPVWGLTTAALGLYMLFLA